MRPFHLLLVAIVALSPTAPDAEETENETLSPGWRCAIAAACATAGYAPLARSCETSTVDEKRVWVVADDGARFMLRTTESLYEALDGDFIALTNSRLVHDARTPRNGFYCPAIDRDLLQDVHGLPENRKLDYRRLSTMIANPRQIDTRLLDLAAADSARLVLETCARGAYDVVLADDLVRSGALDADGARRIAAFVAWLGEWVVDAEFSPGETLLNR